MPMRLIAVTLVGAAALSSSATLAQIDPTASSVRFDCGAFRKNLDGSWTTTRDTAVYAGWDEDSGKRDLASGTRLGTNTFRPMNADMVELLDVRCKPPRT